MDDLKSQKERLYTLLGRTQAFNFDIESLLEVLKQAQEKRLRDTGYEDKATQVAIVCLLMIHAGYKEIAEEIDELCGEM